MYNKQVLSEALANLQKRKARLTQPKDIIVDPRGQYDHPGELTRIYGEGNGTSITMQPDPKTGKPIPYPVMAYPNIGQPQMMYPGNEYYFPGADSVVEKPMAKYGGTMGDPPPIYVDRNDPAGRARYEEYREILRLYNMYERGDLVGHPSHIPFNPEVYRKKPVEIRYKPNKKLVENLPHKNVTMPISLNTNEIKKTDLPRLNLHREWNPYTKSYEVMGPSQKNILEKSYYKGDEQPNLQPDLLDAVSRKRASFDQRALYQIANPESYPEFNQMIQGASKAILKYGGLTTGLRNTSGNLLMNKKGKRLMAQSGSLSATNELFLGNPLLTKRRRAVYVPGAAFQDGGSIDAELTAEEIDEYKKGGYIVEELPKAQEGLFKTTPTPEYVGYQGNVPVSESTSRANNNYVPSKKEIEETIDYNNHLGKLTKSVQEYTGQSFAQSKLDAERLIQFQSRPQAEIRQADPEGKDKNLVYLDTAGDAKTFGDYASIVKGVISNPIDAATAFMSPGGFSNNFYVNQGKVEELMRDGHIDYDRVQSNPMMNVVSMLPYAIPGLGQAAAMKDLFEGASAMYRNPTAENAMWLGLDLIGAKAGVSPASNRLLRMQGKKALKTLGKPGEFVARQLPGSGVNASKFNIGRDVMYTPQDYNIEELRRALHNNKRILTTGESRFLDKYGRGAREDYSDYWDDITLRPGRQSDENLLDDFWDDGSLMPNNQLNLFSDYRNIDTRSQADNIIDRFSSPSPEQIRNRALTNSRLSQQYAANNYRPMSNQLSDIPAELNVMPDGSWVDIGRFNAPTDYVSGSYRPDYATLPNEIRDLPRIPLTTRQVTAPSYDIDALATDFYRYEAGLQPINYPNLSRSLNREQLSLSTSGEHSAIRTPAKVKNRSGLTKEEALEKAAAKNKDNISKMSEEDFANTVLKPNGEVVTYQRGKKAEGVIPMEAKEYAEEWNTRLEQVNKIINDNNNSGIRYEVSKVHPDGLIDIYTPKQTLADGTVVEEGFNTVRFNMNPGRWSGKVEDIPSLDYIQSIPGLSAFDTSQGLFPRGSGLIGTPGTGFYKSLRSFMKKYDLGTLKDGNSGQTRTKINPNTGKPITGSFEVHENAIRKGKAYGFYSNMNNQINAIYKRKGGFINAELTAKEIDNYRRGGYIVEEYQQRGKTSFDFDNTLTTPQGLEMAQNTPGLDKYLISARSEVSPDMYNRAMQAGIPNDRIIAAGSDENKLAHIKRLGIDTHVDDKKSVINKLGNQGILLQSGGDVKSSYGWDYKKEGDKYFTKKVGTDKWIEPTGEALKAIQQKVFGDIEYTESDKKSDYINNVQNLISSGYTLDDLVKQRVGTKEGLTKLFPELSKTKSTTTAKSKEVTEEPIEEVAAVEEVFPRRNPISLGLKSYNKAAGFSTDTEAIKARSLQSLVTDKAPTRMPGVPNWQEHAFAINEGLEKPEYTEAELTDEEIAELQAQGHIVEEVTEPEPWLNSLQNNVSQQSIYNTDNVTLDPFGRKPKYGPTEEQMSKLQEFMKTPEEKGLKSWKPELISLKSWGDPAMGPGGFSYTLGKDSAEKLQKVEEVLAGINTEGLGNVIEQIQQGSSGPTSLGEIKVLKEEEPLKETELVYNIQDLDPFKFVGERNGEIIQTYIIPLINEPDTSIMYRNRGDESDIMGKKLAYTYAPFKPYKETLNKKYGNLSVNDNTYVIALTADGIKGGKLKDFKDTDTPLSPTYVTENVTELVIEPDNKYFDGIGQRGLGLKTSKDTVKYIPVGTSDSQSGSFKNWSGGHLLVENPKTKVIVVLHGRSDQLKEMFNKYLETEGIESANIYETDHKAYSLITNPKDGIHKGNKNRQLDNYNTERSGAGNFIYLQEINE